MLQGGPLPVINRVLTAISRVITPHITGSGTHLVTVQCFKIQKPKVPTNKRSPKVGTFRTSPKRRHYMTPTQISCTTKKGKSLKICHKFCCLFNSPPKWVPFNDPFPKSPPDQRCSKCDQQKAPHGKQWESFRWVFSAFFDGNLGKLWMRCLGFQKKRWM